MKIVTTASLISHGRVKTTRVILQDGVGGSDRLLTDTPRNIRAFEVKREEAAEVKVAGGEE